MAKIGRPAKINPKILQRMLKENKTLKECAAFFGCSVVAVSVQKKKLGIETWRSSAAEHAPAIVKSKLNAIEQLDYLWNCTDEILTACMNWLRGDDDPESALRILESQVKYVMVGDDANKEAVKEYKFKDPRELALKAIGQAVSVNREKRELLKTLYDVEVVREFMREVVNIIGEASPELKSKLIANIRDRGALRSALDNAGR